MKPITEQRIIIPGRTCFNPYYTTSAWWKNEESFLFFSTPPGLEKMFLHFYDPAQGKILSELALTDWFGRPAVPVGEEMLSALPLPDEGKVLIPRGNELFLLDPVSGDKELIYTDRDSSIRLGGPLTLSCSGNYFACGTYTTPPHPRLLVFDRKKRKLLQEIDFGDFHANHFQFQSNDDFLTYAHEGATETIPDRINRINWRTGERTVLHRHLLGEQGELLECIGHEMTRGKNVCAVRYPVSRLPGALVAMNEDGSDYLVLDCDDYWHSSCNADGTVFVMDTMWWGNTKRKQEHVMDIIRIDRIAGTKEILKTIHSNPASQLRHPHPQLNKKGDKILFHEDAAPNEGAITLLSIPPRRRT